MKSLGVVFCVLCLVPGSVDGQPASNDGVVGSDCGINALYVLMSLEERPVALERLASALPPSQPEGYSMAELSAAARSLGLTLEGIELAKAGTRPDRPVIAFMKQNGRGHFAVLRPVGTTGTMVQVIDPPYPPRLIDYERLLELENWTGRALVGSTIWTSNVYALLVSAVAGAVACSLAALRRRWRRVGVV